MVFLNTVSLCGALALLALHEGRCDSTARPGCPRCPDTAIAADASEPFIRKAYEDTLSAKVWATGAMVPQTLLLAELRDILLEMSASDSIYFSHVTFMHALWSSALLSVPNLYTSMCPFTTVINNSIAYDKSRNESLFLQTFYQVSGTVYDACNIITYASLVQTRCAELPTPPEFSRDCYENGLVFDANRAWNLFGNLVPCILTDIFFKLYDSKVYLERAHAAILAYILTPAQFQLFLDHPPATLFETEEIFVESPNVSRCCCACKKSRLDALCFQHNETVYANTTSEAILINGENCD